MAGSQCTYDQGHNLYIDNKKNGTNNPSLVDYINSPKQESNTITNYLYPLEECDPNSQDSGYGNMSDKDEKPRKTFQFTEPLGMAPKRLSMDLFLSPARSTVKSPIFLSPNGPSNFRSLSSGYESTDDGFNELIDMETLDRCHLPNGISTLISGEIMNSEKPMECDTTTPELPKPKSQKMRYKRRSLSFQAERSEFGTPSNVRSCLFRSPNATCSASKLSFDERSRTIIEDSSPELRGRSFKRPEPPTEGSPVLVKKYKKTNFQQLIDIKTPEPIRMVARTPLSRCLSENDQHTHIKQALHRSQNFDDLTGDFSKSCALPLAEGKHHDLKSISPTTLANLMEGHFQQQVDDFHIIDCRYPYEYDGGHISGAVNLYTEEMIERFLIDPVGTKKPEIQPEHNKRSILVFHCEFSFKRGPSMSRFLRQLDRKRNHDCYPALHYPELYLLDGGYKKFYQEYQSFCTPQGYRTMQDPRHEEDFKQFRTKSKSWQGEKTSRTVNINKNNLKRLGF